MEKKLPITENPIAQKMHMSNIEKNSAYSNPLMNFTFQIQKTFVAVA